MPSFTPSRFLRAVNQKHMPTKWSDTLALPRSAFPARPTVSDLERYRQRCADDLYRWQRIHRPATVVDRQGKEQRNEFILHDGPPYANGAVHVGHGLNKVLKDLILRWQLSKGRRVRYQPGWDCHGLPIELKALQAHRTQTAQSDALEDAPREEAKVAAVRSEMSAPEIRRVAAQLARETIDVQKKSFREWGVMGDWDEPYTTMSLQFEIEQLDVFKRMAQRGLISRHHRPVYWSPSSRTALAEAELEYDDNHKCTAAFIKMPFVRLPKVLQDHPALSQSAPSDVSALIWTTTPWTLPANQAIAVHPEMDYTIISVSNDSGEHVLVIAKERVDYVLSFVSANTTTKIIVDTITGSELADGYASCRNIFQGHESSILKADFVTASSGTGVVHMAPGHGMEDYQVCRVNGVGSIMAPVDDEARFTADVFPTGKESGALTGLDAQTAGVDTVLRILRDPKEYVRPDGQRILGNLVFASHDFTHKNPIDWRTKQPVIVRATAQWFADVSAIKSRALAAIDDVEFIPEAGKVRLRSFVEGRSQWCISRQRAWGVPIPALYHNATGEACITETSINHIIATIKERGTDAWFSDPPDERAWIHPSLELDTWTRGKDTMDVWFDSGTTWTTLSGQRADVYIEGSDQHRGWFQSSLLTYIATQEPSEKLMAPYQTLITHGFTLDGDGRKMSKSLGNVISPDQIMDGSLLPPIKPRKPQGKDKTSTPKKDGPHFDAMGPDVLRLWIASSDYTRDVSISVPVLQSVQQALQKYRVTFKFLLGVLSDWQESQSNAQNSKNLTFADRAVLHQLSKASHAIYQAYDECKFYKVVNEINTFVNADLSAFYFEVIKDNMYAGGDDVRRRTQRVLASILRELLKMLGPITPHLIEEVCEFMPPALAEQQHPLQQVWDAPFSAADQLAGNEEKELAIFRALNSAVKNAQEAARNAGKLRSGLACKVEIHLPSQTPEELMQCALEWDRSGQLSELLVVSQAHVIIEDGQNHSDAEWVFQQEFDVDEQLKGRAVVLPPDYHKCVRCWKYTAEKQDELCERCTISIRRV